MVTIPNPSRQIQITLNDLTYILTSQQTQCKWNLISEQIVSTDNYYVYEINKFYKSLM